MTTPEIYQVAAVDLGSNSFHMIVMQVSNGRLQVVDKIKESIRMAAGLDDNNRLSKEVMDRAIECLQRFGQRIGDLPRGNVRVVGTNTLRKAKNSRKFLARAEQAIGHPIDIISGREEARLIYLGVSHSLEDDSKSRLVIDIGGGSTEFILGKQFHPKRMESLHMGCVVMTAKFFKDGVIDQRRIGASEILALQELEAIAEQYKKTGWGMAIGASGSILAIHNVVIAQGWSDDGITPESLEKLKASLIEAGHVDNIKLEGLQANRTAIFPGGVSILSAAFEALSIEKMRVSDGALREGAIYDLLGRIRKEDVRGRTVEELCVRYHINKDQSSRVEETTLKFLGQSGKHWNFATVSEKEMLSWAARLHEIGLAISYSQYHKHGYYLLSHLDMPGFSRGDQQILATLVRSHRRKFPVEEIQALPKPIRKTVRQLCILLRLAFLLHRGQSDVVLPEIKLLVDEKTIRLTFPKGWLQQHPLTRADFKQEAGYLDSVGFALEFN